MNNPYHKALYEIEREYGADETIERHIKGLLNRMFKLDAEKLEKADKERNEHE